MLEIKNTRVFGLEESIVASGNPMTIGDIDSSKVSDNLDLRRAKKLGHAVPGSGHDCFLKGIVVQADIKYSSYWSMEAQRYKWFDIVSSQSKQHRLMEMDFDNCFNKYVHPSIIVAVKVLQDELRKAKQLYDSDPSHENKGKLYQAHITLLSNLPHGYEMWMTISTNYLQLKTIYHQRKNHKLKEDWGIFCFWVEGLPMFTDLILKKATD